MGCVVLALAGAIRRPYFKRVCTESVSHAGLSKAAQLSGCMVHPKHTSLRFWLKPAEMQATFRRLRL